MLDVVVVGSGPVGSRVAYKLAGMGYQVSVFEKKSEIGQKNCCTGIISRECASAFAIPSSVFIREVNSAKIIFPGGENIRISRPEAQAYIVDRPAFDCSLSERARSEGVEYHLSSEAEQISFQENRVVLEVKEKGKVRQVEAKAVVLATGFHSPLVTRLSLGRIGYFAAGAQAEVGVDGVDEVEVYFNQKLAPGFFAWIVPASPGKYLIGLLARRFPDLHLRDFVTWLNTQGKTIRDKYQVRYGGVPLKPLTHTYRDRLLVVGDAAGQVKPTTGGGIYFGLLCADIAATTLNNAFQAGDLSSRRLSDYERNWQKKLGRELRTEYFARRIFEHLNNKQIDGICSRLKSANIESWLRQENLSFDWHGSLMLKVVKMSVVSQMSRMLRLPKSLRR